jgi:hypothetical protein
MPFKPKPSLEESLLLCWRGSECLILEPYSFCLVELEKM